MNPLEKGLEKAKHVPKIDILQFCKFVDFVGGAYGIIDNYQHLPEEEQSILHDMVIKEIIKRELFVDAANLLAIQLRYEALETALDRGDLKAIGIDIYDDPYALICKSNEKNERNSFKGIAVAAAAITELEGERGRFERSALSDAIQAIKQEFFDATNDCIELNERG